MNTSIRIEQDLASRQAMTFLANTLWWERRLGRLREGDAAPAPIAASEARERAAA